jgi:hypothetical protein
VLTFSAHQAIWPESGYGVVLLFNSGSGLMLDQTAIVHGVLDLVGGAAPTESVGGIRLTAILDAALALFTLATLFLGVQGVLSARRWARRHRRTPLRLVVRLLPFLVPVGVGAAFPALVESVMGRDVTWRAVAYGWPALAVFACAALAAALVILLARSMVAVRECRGHAAPELSRP